MDIKLFNDDSNCKSLREFLDKNTNIKVNPDEFLEENRWLVFSQLTFSEKLKVQSDLGKYTAITENDLTLDTFLPCPCELKTDAKNVDIELIIKNTNAYVKSNSVDNFIVDNVSNLYKYDKDSVKLSPDAAVFYYPKKTLYMSKYGDKLIHNNLNEFIKFYLLTNDFIKSISTNVSASGGTFNLNIGFSLSPYLQIENHKITISEDFSNVANYSDFNYYLFNYFGRKYDIDKKTIRDDVLKLFNINDIFLIRLSSNYNTSDEYKVQDNSYDMIGLVDSVDVSIDANANVNVSINGSDLMKLIRDDGSFFFNVSATNDVDSDMFNNVKGRAGGDVQDIDNVFNGKPFDRLRLPYGQLNMFYLRYLDIATVILGTIGRLANISVAPDSLFEPWGDERTKKTDFQTKK